MPTIAEPAIRARGTVRVSLPAKIAYSPDALKKSLADSDFAIASASASALGQIAGTEALAAFAPHLQKFSAGPTCEHDQFFFARQSSPRSQPRPSRNHELNRMSRPRNRKPQWQSPPRPTRRLNSKPQPTSSKNIQRALCDRRSREGWRIKSRP